MRLIAQRLGRCVRATAKTSSGGLCSSGRADCPIGTPLHVHPQALDEPVPDHFHRCPHSASAHKHHALLAGCTPICPSIAVGRGREHDCLCLSGSFSTPALVVRRSPTANQRPAGPVDSHAALVSLLRLLWLRGRIRMYVLHARLPTALSNVPGLLRSTLRLAAWAGHSRARGHPC